MVMTMRLIDADALLNAISVHLERIEQEIDDAPTIVRCKDCTAWQNGVNWPSDLPEDVGVCIIAGWTCGENGYCLYGKRRDYEID